MANENDNETEVIRDHMGEKRKDLQEKLEALEDKVTDTVKGAASAVTETVESVKDTVQEISATVSDTVTGTVETVKETFNFRRHVENHPWAAFGCSFAVGVVGGYLLTPRKLEMSDLSSRGEPKYGTPDVRLEPVSRTGNGFHAQRETAASARDRDEDERPGWFTGWMGDAMKTLAGLGVSTLLGVVRDMSSQSLPQELGSRFSQTIDDLTSKLGLRPIQGPVLQPAGQETASQQASASGPASGDQPRAEGPKGTAKGRRTTDGTGRR